MWTSSNRWWALATALLTIPILVIVFPVLYDKFGLVIAITLSGVLVLGMALSYVRGVLIVTSKK